MLDLLLFFHLFLARTLKSSNFPNIFFCLPEKIKNVIFGSSNTTLKSKWINCFSLQRSEGTSRQVIGEIRRRHKFNFQFNLVKCVNNLGYCVSKLVSQNYTQRTPIRECVRNLDLRVQVHPGELWVSKQRVHHSGILVWN